MSREQCREHNRLASRAHAVLKELHDLTSKQLDAFESGDRTRFIEFDKELEVTVGEKEGAVGALRQHDEEHGCQL